ncbi:MAG: CatA-like O-acetyltransferase [Eubacteriales bacterium]|nr:CatA-like O-acetyltransferase [Eubacteriales bacterium]
MVFHPLDCETWPRAAHFRYYTDTVHTRYNLNVNIDITALYDCVKQNKLRFYPTVLWMIMRVVNDTIELRMATDADGNPGYWEYCVPSYTIFHKDDHTFSDIWTQWDDDFHTFYAQAVEDMETYADVKGIKAKDGRPEGFAALSMLPWLSFTGHGCDAYTAPQMLFPIFVMGKWREQNGKKYMPLSLSINHAAADGWHSAKALNDIADLAAHPERWIH